MTNIKNIGKELLGKSLNSFHRKTGLTQLEKNNEMQDGILNGILSQVDDAYIEKTEQSNVIHLDGSGDGVVVLDSIEGNTMVNLCTDNTSRQNVTYTSRFLTNGVKHSTDYTIIFELYDVVQNTSDALLGVSIENAPAYELGYCELKNGIHKVKITTRNGDSTNISKPSLDLTSKIYACFWVGSTSGNQYSIRNVVVLEGNYKDKEVPTYFEGLQSSFEEHKEEDQYKIEILMKNNNLIGENFVFNYGLYDTKENYTNCFGISINPTTRMISEPIPIDVTKNMYFKCKGYMLGHIYFDKDLNFIVDNGWKQNQTPLSPPSNAKYICSYIRREDNTTLSSSDLRFVEKNAILGFYNKFEDIEEVAHKSNKIKLLINEPLRSTTLGKDRLCIVDGKLMIERKNKQIIINGEERYKQSNLGEVVNCAYFEILDIVDAKIRTQNGEVYCDRLPSLGEVNKYLDKENIFCDPNYNLIGIKISRSKLTTHDIDGIKTYFRNNNTKLCYPLKEPYYEEVLNEYGEPILLEGYENGTLYIDSTIVPSTTVRYTPKMESFNTLKEVSNNNIMLTNDINNTIVPYMMEVDLMIMEKEVALMSQKNIRKIGAEDMTSMQKRTQQMLERLIKGKTLTVDECKTRVAVYLNADKITDAQAEELMLLIDEVYA